MRTQTYILLGTLAAAAALWLWSRTSAGESAVGSVADYLGDLVNGPRGIRNNNPGNVKRSSIKWQGSIPPDQVRAVLGVDYDPVMEQMLTPEDGVRMIGHILRAKQARGLVSVDQIIRDYSETDQDAYIAYVAKGLGVEEDQPIDVTAVLPAFATLIIQQENGEQPYELSDIANWVYA